MSNLTGFSSTGTKLINWLININLRDWLILQFKHHQKKRLQKKKKILKTHCSPKKDKHSANQVYEK